MFLTDRLTGGVLMDRLTGGVLTDRLTEGAQVVIHQNRQAVWAAAKYFAVLGRRYVLKDQPDQVYVSRDHNVYKDSYLHPIHFHNVDKS
jgi:hypothetical protein